MTQPNILDFETVALDDDRDALLILDQTQLPGKAEILSLRSQEEIRQAIYLLRVRGAPAIGVAAAIGIYLIAKAIQTTDMDDFVTKFGQAKAYLASARPTAVNLFWALDRMESVILSNRELGVNALKLKLHDEALAIRAEDIQVSRMLGEHGLTLIQDGDGILTHCNAGQLATAKYGTALAPIHLGRERGYTFSVYTDETRPLLQGARLSAFELVSHGIDTTVICDNMASQVMQNGWVQAVFVGCDRVASNGDSCNKIGTCGVAILAKHYGIPFYVFAPTSTLDMRISCGAEIPIEERPAHEVTEMWYTQRMAPHGVKVYNPAFDVTPHALITAIVTENGIARPPYTKSLRNMMRRRESP